MSNELGEMIREILRIASDVVVGKIQLKTAQYRTDKVIKKMEDWHIRERKKWALGLLGDDAEYPREGSLKPTIFNAYKNGYNVAKAEIRKKIEED